MRPIDVLYGRYDPAQRSIEIFVNNIQRDAKSFGAELDELVEIVRIHEYAHVIVHLGVRTDKMQEQLSSFGSEKKTDWTPFLANRGSRFNSLPTECHELIAQAITYASLGTLFAAARSERLRAIFDALEAKQGAHYKLPPPVKEAAVNADWPLVLDTARGVYDDFYRREDFSLVAGITALICGQP